MRSIVIKDIVQRVVKGDELLVPDKFIHHLANVVRLKKGENVLVSDGNGKHLICEVLEISNKKISLTIQDIHKKERFTNLTLAQGMVKREAWAEILRSSVELGIREIIPVETQYSQRIKNSFSNERGERVIESAIIQSNNPYVPSIEDGCSFEGLLNKVLSFDRIYVLTCSKLTNNNFFNSFNPSDKNLLVIGPEGGLSRSEEESFIQFENVQFINFQLPIMRAPTAVAAGVGFLMGQINNNS